MKKTLFTLACLWFCTASILAECIFFKPIQIKEVQIGNLISWSTLSEVGNEKFIIEKSVDGVSFVAIGEVTGSGDSEEVKDYRFLDLKTGVTESFYRLRMVNDNKYESLTHTIFFNREASNNYIYVSMSSPMTANHFSLTLDSKQEGKLSYSLLNQKKEVKLKKSRRISQGLNVISISLKNLPIGTYKFKTELNNEVEEVVIRKVKPESLPTIDYVIK